MIRKKKGEAGIVILEEQKFDIWDLSWAAYAECVKAFSVSVWTGRDCFWWLHISFSQHQIGCVPSLVWMLPPLDFQADRPQEVAVAFRLLRQIRPAAFIGRHLVVLFQLEFVRNILNWQPQYKLISWMLTWGPWPAAPSCLSSWWPPCLWCLHLCLPRHPAVSPTPQQPPLQRASCHSLLCSQPWQRKAVLELPVVYLNRCREKINTHDMNIYEQSSLIEFTVFECILFACYRWCIISDACRTTWCHPAGLSCWSLQCWQARCWWWAISSSLARSENLKMNVRKSWGEAHFLSLISESAADSWFERSISSGRDQSDMKQRQERPATETHESGIVRLRS